jgi:hypothetical protein
MTRAKKQDGPNKRFSVQGWDASHYQKTEAYVAVIDKLYNEAIAEFARLAMRTNIDPDKPFSFADYPSTSATAQNIINGLASNMQAVIEKGSRNEWLYACKKNDEFLQSIMNTSKVGKRMLSKMQDRNLDALDAFQKRKVNGLDLSKRVWKYAGQFKKTMEFGIDIGIGEGRSAQQLSKDLRGSLIDPDRLFRRVRDKRGQLHLSKAAAAFHPGQGVYRSSYKNAMRLTRSEINMAYRESERLRWANLDFVVGFEIRLSNNHTTTDPKTGKKVPFVDICDTLAGRYPKSFVFKGWHPQCRCLMVPILQDPDEFDNQELDEMKAALKGTEYKKYASRNLVSEVPDKFKQWIKEHEEAAEGWSSIPYFIKDNFKGGRISGGLNLIKPKIEKPKVDPKVAELAAIDAEIAALKPRCLMWGVSTEMLNVVRPNNDPVQLRRIIKALEDQITKHETNYYNLLGKIQSLIGKAEKLGVNGAQLKSWSKSLQNNPAIIGNPNITTSINTSIQSLESDIANAVLNQSKGAKIQTPEHVRDEIKTVGTKEGWFEHGFDTLAVDKNRNNNGSTDMKGKISLAQDRLELCVSAMNKVKNGIDITFNEADAMATLWHEITHNRNKQGNMFLSTLERRFMELANEFVARKTLPEFYKALGAKDTPHTEFTTNRSSTAYNDMVCNYDRLIDVLGLDRSKVLSIVKKHLFEGRYTDQMTGLIDGVSEGFKNRINPDTGRKFTKTDIKRIIKFCYSGEDSFDYYLKHYNLKGAK